MDLHALARSYLEAGGYEILQDTHGFLDMAAPEEAKDLPARLLIWSDDSLLAASSELKPAEQAARNEREQALLARFAAELATAPGAVGYYLVRRRLGLSAEFVAKASKLLAPPGGIRVPVEFFDTAYKVDQGTGGKARSVLGDLLKQTEKVRRVAQPFLIRHGLDPDNRVRGNGDLVNYLETALRDPDPGPKLRFIDGSAGSGKTVAFNALVKVVFEEFIAAKQERLQRPRPIVFLPDHIRGEAIGYVDDVIDAAIATDMAQAVEPEQCRWLLRNGFSLWMFDGLDEFYAGDNDFFAFLEEMLSHPASQAQFLICTRDSLLSSNAAMRAFIERQLSRGRAVEIYELAPWDTAHWAQMAWLELENGRAGAENSSRVRQFVSGLEASETLASLARLPFYCAVMLERFKAQKAMPKDEFELLQFIVDRMMEREHGKDIFRWRDFVDLDALSEAIEDEASALRLTTPDSADTRALLAQALDGEGRNTLFELIEAIAHGYRRNPDAAGAAGGFALDDLRGFFGQTYTSSNLQDPDVERLVTVLVQFAFFGQGRRAGSVDFTHHILADYLAGRYAVGLLRRAAEQQEQISASGRRPSLSDVTRRASVFRQAIGTAPLTTGSLFHRYIAREIDRDARLREFVLGLRGHADLGRETVAAALRVLAP